MPESGASRALSRRVAFDPQAERETDGRLPVPGCRQLAECLSVLPGPRHEHDDVARDRF